MKNLVSAWNNYYFASENRYFKVTKLFGGWLVYENLVDDVEELVFEGSFEECVAFCESLEAENYDPLAKYR